MRTFLPSFPTRVPTNLTEAQRCHHVGQKQPNPTHRHPAYCSKYGVWPMVFYPNQLPSRQRASYLVRSNTVDSDMVFFTSLTDSSMCGVLKHPPSATSTSKLPWKYCRRSCGRSVSRSAGCSAANHWLLYLTGPRRRW